MKHIYYKNDFAVEITLLNASGEVVSPPDWQWHIEFTDGRRKYICSVDKGNANVVGNTIMCYLDNHKFCCGEIGYKFVQAIPDLNYLDGFQNLITPKALPIELWEKESDNDINIQSSVVPAYVVYDAYMTAKANGYDGTAEEFYDALNHIVDINKKEAERVEAEANRVTAEQQRVENFAAMESALRAATSKANTATTKAEEATKMADNSATAASQATTQATTATKRANDISADLEAKREADYWRGAKGDKGEKGDTGAKGDRGEKGEQGERGLQGVQGVKGDDGVSPTVSTSKTGKVTTIEITDAKGTHTATVNDGESVEVVQSTGNSTTAVMSQKAVSDAIDVVADSINKLKNAGYLYAGIANPTTNPGTPDGPVFYIALQAGTYSNFGNTEIDNTGIFTWDGTSWSFEKLDFGGGSNIEIINDLTTGGDGNALSAEMGKVLADSCGVEKDVFTQTLGYNIFPAKGDYPIMIAGKTYSINIQGDKPMGQTQWEVWGRTASGKALIRKFGSTDMSVEQVITYTPDADIYAIGCNYSIDVQDTTVMITYQIDYGTYHSEHERRLKALDEVLQYGTALIIDVSGIQKISDKAPYWVYKQRIPIMFAGGTYKITVTAGAVLPSSQKFELWCSDYDLTSSTRVKLFEITGVDMSIGASFMVTATQDIYSLYCGYQNAGLGSTITMAYKVEQAKESQRLHDIEDDVRACEDAISSAGINRFNSYYRLGATENDTINLITRPIGLIVMGQSNADGRIPNSSFPSTATIDTTDDLTLSKQLGHCLFMKGDKESTYSEPSKNFAARNNSGNWAFDDIVYNAVNHALGGNTDFYVIKQTRGATGIRLANGSFNANVNDFVKNGYAISQLYHFKLLIERALELNPNIDFKAILWHQGEAEWVVTEEGLYYECLCQIIYWLRGKVGNPKLPFIFGTVPTDSEQYSAVVKADMEKVAQDINDCYLVDLGAAGDMIDQFHFGASTAERLAREMFKIMRQNYMLAPMINPL